MNITLGAYKTRYRSYIIYTGMRHFFPQKLIWLIFDELPFYAYSPRGFLEPAACENLPVIAFIT